MYASSGGIAPRQLTRRQAECVELVAKGLSSKEIGRELGISPSTVDNHIAAVMHQFNLPNRSALIRFSDSENRVGQRLILEARDHASDMTDSLIVQEPVFLGPCSCIVCKGKNYLKTSLLPSFIFAMQCSAFLVLFLLGLHYFFGVRLIH